VIPTINQPFTEKLRACRHKPSHYWSEQLHINFTTPKPSNYFLLDNTVKAFSGWYGW